MPDMTAVAPEPRTKSPTGPSSAPMLPVLTTPAPDPADDIPDPPLPPLPIVDAQIHVNRLADLLERQAVHVEDIDAGALAALKALLRMPQEASSLPQGIKDTPGALKSSWAEHETLLQGFCEALQNKLRTWMVQEAIKLDSREEQRMQSVRDWLQTIGTANEHASYQLSSSLDALLKNGLAVLSPPYQAVVAAVSPPGYPITFTCANVTSAGLLAELSTLVMWLQTNGFTVPLQG